MMNRRLIGTVVCLVVILLTTFASSKEALAQQARDKERQKMLINELNHRVKNTLATVRAITSQSLRTAISTEHAERAIDSRLGALGHAHDLLMQASWASASFAQIIRSATEPYDS